MHWQGERGRPGVGYCRLGGLGVVKTWSHVSLPEPHCDVSVASDWRNNKRTFRQRSLFDSLLDIPLTAAMIYLGSTNIPFSVRT